jgi:hypothetical protein
MTQRSNFLVDVIDLQGLPPIPELLDNNGVLKLLPAHQYDLIDHDVLRAWCMQNARYGLPTVELVEWLKDLIGGRRAIEIGSGAGDLAFHLGIKATDSKVQQTPFMQIYYKLLQQSPIKYPEWVEKIDAMQAIIRYRPQVVVASWVTQKVMEPDGDTEGCYAGVEEDAIVASGVEYVMIGNKFVHQQKKIMRLPHVEYELPFLRSRARLPEQNVVYVWNEHQRPVKP